MTFPHIFQAFPFILMWPTYSLHSSTSHHANGPNIPVKKNHFCSKSCLKQTISLTNWTLIISFPPWQIAPSLQHSEIHVLHKRGCEQKLAHRHSLPLLRERKGRRIICNDPLQKGVYSFSLKETIYAKGHEVQSSACHLFCVCIYSKRRASVWKTFASVTYFLNWTHR